MRCPQCHGIVRSEVFYSPHEPTQIEYSCSDCGLQWYEMAKTRRGGI